LIPVIISLAALLLIILGSNFAGTGVGPVSANEVTGTNAALAGIIYVDADASGAGNGLSWNDAYNTLPLALVDAESGDEIWVAEGIYTPTVTFRDSYFYLKNGVGIYGGFVGNETQRSQRDWQANVTILSGDIGTEGVATDNSYHVVVSQANDETAVLDGVTISGGYADVETSNRDIGGGLYVELGGTPSIANVNFIDNYALNYGAGMVAVDDGSGPHVVNCTFSGNSTNGSGAVASVYTATVFLINSTVVGNSGTSGGGITAALNGDVTVRNSISYSNTVSDADGVDVNIEYSLIGGGSVFTGTGNINSPPNFVDADGPDNIFGTLDDNLHLIITSPAIDAADNDAVIVDLTDMDGNGVFTETVPLDMDGNDRFVNTHSVPDTGNGSPPIVDMGAYDTPVLPFFVYLPVIIIDN